MKNLCTNEPNRQISGKTRGGRSSRRRTERGAAMMAVVALTLFASMILGAVLLNARNQYTLTWARTNSESALLLAEGAINNEISYINKNMYNTTATTRSTQNTTANGEPFKGRKGSISGTDGEYWVFTSADAAGTTAWDGNSSTLYITANARVNGAWRQVQVGGPNMYRSIYTVFGVFTNNGNNSTNGNSLTTTDGSRLSIFGHCGTNGGCSKGTGSTITFNSATNCNNKNNTQPKFTSSTSPVYNQPDSQPYPSSTEVLKRCTGKTWSQISSSNSNNLIRTYRPSNPSLTPAGTQTNGITDGNLDANKWATANKGTNGNTKYLIFPPGDYYFSNCWLDYAQNYEIIIDDLGLTVGGNPNNQPVRWFIRNYFSTGDLVAIPMTSTYEITKGTANPSGFRIIYGSQSTLTVDRRNNPGHDSVYGTIYAVADTSTDIFPSRVALKGKSSGQSCNVVGGIVADTISVDGECTVNYTAAPVANAKYDPPCGVTFTGGYKCRG